MSDEQIQNYQDRSLERSVPTPAEAPATEPMATPTLATAGAGAADAGLTAPSSPPSVDPGTPTDSNGLPVVPEIPGVETSDMSYDDFEDVTWYESYWGLLVFFVCFGIIAGPISWWIYPKDEFRLWVRIAAPAVPLLIILIWVYLPPN